MFYVYILYSSKYDRSYVGISQDVNRRLSEHNRGYTKSTKSFVPWKLIYKEPFSNMKEARRREKYLKSAAGRRWRKGRLKIDMGD